MRGEVREHGSPRTAKQNTQPYPIKRQQVSEGVSFTEATYRVEAHMLLASSPFLTLKMAPHATPFFEISTCVCTFAVNFHTF